MITTGSDDGVRLSGMPDLGPNGLVLVHNERVEPLSVKDVFEVLRWMRDDLKRIHLAFGYLHGMQLQMERIKGIHLQQGLRYKNFREQIASLEDAVMKQSVQLGAQSVDMASQGRQLAEQAAQISKQAESIAMLTSELKDTRHALAEVTGSVVKILERVNVPWWKKVFERK